MEITPGARGRSRFIYYFVLKSSIVRLYIPLGNTLEIPCSFIDAQIMNISPLSTPTTAPSTSQILVLPTNFCNTGSTDIYGGPPTG